MADDLGAWIGNLLNSPALAGVFGGSANANAAMGDVSPPRGVQIPPQDLGTTSAPPIIPPGQGYGGGMTQQPQQGMQQSPAMPMPSPPDSMVPGPPPPVLPPASMGEGGAMGVQGPTPNQVPMPPPVAPPPGQGFGGGSPTAQMPLPPPANVAAPAMAGGAGGNAPFGNRAPLPPPSANGPMPGGAPQPGANHPAVPGLLSGLASALGVNTPQGMQAMIAGIGKGLSTVQGPSGLATFARGAGGSISGVQEARDKQEAQSLARTASLKGLDLTNAQIGNYKSLEAARAAGGVGGLRNTQLLLTDAGKVQAADREAQHRANLVRQTYMEELKTADPKRADEIRKIIDDAGKAARQESLKRYGIDSDKAEKLRKLGTDEKTPFEAKGMSAAHFHEQVPVSTVDASGRRIGGWYTTGATYKDGEKDASGKEHKEGEVKLFQRVTPPPGTQAMPATPGPQAHLLPEDLSTQGEAAA